MTESDGDKVWNSATELQTTNYRLYSCPRKNRRGGGIALCTRPTYKARLISEREKSTFQYAKWCMETSHMCLTVLGIYHPPFGSAIKFLGELAEWLPENALLDTNPIIMGDFNLHVNNENDDDSMNFLGMMLALGLKQNVMFDTHKLANTLDLIFTETDSTITVKLVYKGKQLLDHTMVHMVLSLRKDKYEKHVIQFRDLTNLNYEELADDINIWYALGEERDIDIVSAWFNQELSDALEKHAPMQSKSVIDRKRVPWFIEEVKNSKHIMRRCEHLWRKYKHDDLWETFKTARNIFKNTLRKAKHKFYSDKIQDCRNDTHKLFQIINTLTGSKPENPMPECDNDQQLADEFAEFFAEKIDRIRSDLDHYLEYIPEHKDVPVIDKFLPIDQEEITKTIFSMETKHCELDSIPMSVLKNLVPYIIDDITHVVKCVTVNRTVCDRLEMLLCESTD